MLPKLTGIDEMTFQLVQLLKTSPWDTDKHRERDSRASMMHFSLMFYLQNNTMVDKHTEGRVLWEMFSLTDRIQVCVTDVWLKVCEVSPPVLNLSQILPEQDPAPLNFGLFCSGTYLAGLGTSHCIFVQCKNLNKSDQCSFEMPLC
jgi:hypothetical protein